MKAYILLAVILLIMYYKYTNSVNNFIGGEDLVAPNDVGIDESPLEVEAPSAPAAPAAPSVVSIDEYNRKLKEIDMLNNQAKRYDTRIRNLVKQNRSMRASRRADYLMNKYDTDPKNGMITYKEIVNKETSNSRKF